MARVFIPGHYIVNRCRWCCWLQQLQHISSSDSLLRNLREALPTLWRAISQSTPNEGTIYFALFLIIFTWILGYFSSWRLLRRQSVWPAIFLGLIAVLINLDYLGKNSYGYFFLYLFTAILLVSYVSFIRQRFSFQSYHVKYPLSGMLWLWLCFMFCLVLIGGSGAPEIGLINF
jgi:hypothetical protein